MASLKEVKTRINSVKSTRKITSAMKMVASAKLHKAQGAIENMLPYQKKLNKILTNFLSADLPIESPYIRAREVKRVAIIAFSSNTSLCGAFNANVIKMLLQTVSEYRTLGQDNILIFPIGKKVEEAVKRMGFQPGEIPPTLSDKPTYQEASDLALNVPTSQTVLASVRLNGQITYTMYPGGTSGERFLDYLKNVLIPTLHKGDIVVMDNMRSHHVKGVEEVLRAAGMIPLYLPPYSPDLNPIEMLWSKMKAILRKLGCNIAALLPQMVAEALALVSPEDCLGWFTADGY